jgi:hypothetical protein
MPTIIHFVGRDQIMVREDEDQVQAAFGANAGMPVALTHHRTGNPVFVNLGQVTYWQGRPARELTPLPWPAVDRVPAASR